MRITTILLLTILCATAHAAPIKLTVQSADGVPVVGATVYAGDISRTDFLPDNGSVQKLTTDAAGVATVEAAEKPGGKQFALVRIVAVGHAVLDGFVKTGENTLRLPKSKTVNGAVKDGLGAPVADAVVRVAMSFGEQIAFQDPDMQMGGMGIYLAMLSWMAALPPIETKTGADGRFAFEGVGNAIVHLADPRFGPAQGFAGIPGAPGGDGLMTLTAKPGAALRGQITLPDGKPAAGVLVISPNEAFAKPVRSDAEGRFEITGVAVEGGMLMGVAPNDEFIVPMLQLKALTPGKVNDAPPWKLTRGILISGQVVDKKTKQPIAGAMISSASAGGPPKPTGADGRFAVRVSKEQAFLSVSQPKYAPFWKQFDKIGDVATFDAGIISLDAVQEWTGRIVDAKGEPVKKVMLTVNNEMNYQQGQTGEDGTFKINIAAGVYNAQIQTEGWELLPEKETKVTVVENAKPAELKARKLPVRTVSGRIVTTAGAPVAAVAVQVNANFKGKEEGSSTSLSKTATTDPLGKFSVEFFGDFTLASVGKVEGEGFLLRTAGKGKLRDGVCALDDTVVAALTAQITGRVLDEKGAPLAGALVASPESAKWAITKTADDGTFALKNLPEGQAEVLAAAGSKFARLAVKTGTPAELKVASGGVLVAPMRRQVFEMALRNDTSQINSYRAIISVEKRAALALQKDGALPSAETDLAKADWSKAGAAALAFLPTCQYGDVGWAAANAVTWLKKIPAEKETAARFDAESSAACIAVLRGDDAAKAWASAWLDEALQERDVRGDNVKSAGRYFRLAAIAAALGRPNAPTAKELAVTALAFAEQAGKKSITENARQWGGNLAPGGVEIFAALEEEWPVEARDQARIGAVSFLMRLDMTRARPMLEKWFPGYDGPPATPPTAGEKLTPIQLQLRQDAAEQYRRALTRLDPEAALALLEKTQPGQTDWQLLPVVVRGLVRQGKTEAARRALEPILKISSAPYGLFSYFGALTATSDKELSTKFFAKADEMMENGGLGDPEGQSYYGYYQGAQNPAQARLWLEWLWQRAVQSADPKNPYQSQMAQNGIAAAMMGVDQLRAIEMLGAVPENYNKSQARGFVLAWLMAEPADRPMLRREME